VTGEEARAFLLSLPEAWEDYPFGPDVRVMKVADRMFATLGTDDGLWRVNLKCDPQEALILRDIFEAVRPGYHMNKQHWNTVLLDGSIPDSELERMMENSYDLVIARLPAKVRRPLARLRAEKQP
jgi:predicted DNA-binding protein (MmcQ/YjbR family)